MSRPRGLLLQLPLAERIARRRRTGVALLIGEGRSFRRLAKMAGLSYPDGYVRTFDRVSVMRGRSVTAEHEWMRRILILASGRPVIVLGRRVADIACGFLGEISFEAGVYLDETGHLPWLGSVDYRIRDSGPLLVLPHSLNRGIWNNPEFVKEASGELKSFISRGMSQGRGRLWEE